MISIREILSGIFVLSGLFVLGVATLGLYRFKYVLNRIHAAAKCDTLGALLIIIGLGIMVGFSFTLLKMILLVIFIWLTNPAAVHIIGRVEVYTNPYLKEECEVIEL